MGDPIALTGACVYVHAFEPPIPDGIIVIRDGRIEAVSPSGTLSHTGDGLVIDCAGMAVVAGFWNSHVHFFERKWARADELPPEELQAELTDTFFRYGFTHVFDLGSPHENTNTLRARTSRDVIGPEIFTTGEAILPAGGAPSADVLRVMGVMPLAAPEVSDQNEMSGATRSLLAMGASGLKVFASAQRTVMREDLLRTAVAEARRANVPLFVHPNTGEDVAAAVRAGVDVVAHTTPASGPWSAEMVTTAGQQRTALTPTLALWEFYMRHDRRATREQMLNTALGQLRAWREAGAAVLFGTDLGAVEADPRREYLLMHRAGMGALDVLHSLTSAPAAQFRGGAQAGQVTIGAEANLVVLGRDPAHAIDALWDVRMTFRPACVQRLTAEHYCVQGHRDGLTTLTLSCRAATA